MNRLMDMLVGNAGLEMATNFNQIQQGLDGQPKCKGCSRIEALIRYWNTSTSRRSSGRNTAAPQSRPELIHNSYSELDICAEQCITCRLIRRGILLNLSMENDVINLSSCSRAMTAVWVTIVGAELHGMQVHVSLSKDVSKSVRLTFPTDTGTKIPAEITLARRGDTEAVFSHIRSWAEACHEGHIECGNLNWSNKSPTRLLRILSASKVQLVEVNDTETLVRYVALSYCWGSPDDVATQRGRTVDSNIVRRAREPFSIHELPATIRDAVTVTRGCGLQYIWIDSVCIIQGNAGDWLAEAGRMHEVYSNAVFTLCAVSVESASAGLFHSREAWRYRAEHCRLATKRISSCSVSCRDLVDGSTWSSRAWTLQEEHLSPRIVYWTPQRVHWSCSVCSVAEGDSPTSPGEPVSANAVSAAASKQSVSGISFLAASRSGQHLYERWCDMVESFTKRKLTNARDKFAAISGVAMRYQHCRAGDQYLGGLWVDSLAQDLAWKTPVYLLEVPASPAVDYQPLAPSWSWASLPCAHPVMMRRRAQSDVGGGTRIQLLQSRMSPIKNEKSTISAPTTRSIVVVGRMRPFISPKSQRVDWSDVSVPAVNQLERFSFANHIADDIHSVNLGRGLVMAYEARRDETLGHIDFLTNADRMYQGNLKLECLELGESEMLLLEPLGCTRDGDDSGHQRRSYRRIGVSWKYRVDFFVGSGHVEVELM